MVTETFSGFTSSTTVSGRLSNTAPPTNANLPVTQPGVNCANIGDLNCDGKTNLQDVSILLFYFGKTTFPAHVDLNHDGTINLVDFSILLFYWTEPLSR